MWSTKVLETERKIILKRKYFVYECQDGRATKTVKYVVLEIQSKMDPGKVLEVVLE